MSALYGGHSATTTLVPGKLRGYRGWYKPECSDIAVYPHGLLQSVVQRIHAWPPSMERRAFCTEITGRHRDPFPRKESQLKSPEPFQLRSPEPWCSCGLYASYRPTRGFSGEGDNSIAFQFNESHVQGSVLARGRIVLGTLGFRAEYMTIESLWGPEARDWARLYGVPWFETKEEMLAKFPPSDVSELLKA